MRSRKLSDHGKIALQPGVGLLKVRIIMARAALVKSSLIAFDVPSDDDLLPT